jgi:hypothetical protein
MQLLCGEVPVGRFDRASHGAGMSGSTKTGSAAVLAIDFLAPRGKSFGPRPHVVPREGQRRASGGRLLNHHHRLVRTGGYAGWIVRRSDSPRSAEARHELGMLGRVQALLKRRKHGRTSPQEGRWIEPQTRKHGATQNAVAPGLQPLEAPFAVDEPVDLLVQHPPNDR